MCKTPKALSLYLFIYLSPSDKPDGEVFIEDFAKYNRLDLNIRKNKKYISNPKVALNRVMLIKKQRLILFLNFVVLWRDEVIREGDGVLKDWFNKEWVLIVKEYGNG